MKSSLLSHFQTAVKSQRNEPAARGVVEFLRAHQELSVLIPALTRINTLQKDCATIFPVAFDTCDVLQLEGGQLVIATPNAAFATKLKQNLPKLQHELNKLGWQVSAIRLKVQVTRNIPQTTAIKQLALPPAALTALAELDQLLEQSPGNRALKAALEALVRRHTGNSPDLMEQQENLLRRSG